MSSVNIIANSARGFVVSRIEHESAERDVAGIRARPAILVATFL